jgi:hypothetical protein
MKHAIVYAQPGTFAGWPANNGLWSWDGSELLVGFVAGPFVAQPGHNIAEPYRLLTARSTDQGETWVPSEPAIKAANPHSEDIDFTHPGFALRVAGTGYHGSNVAAGAIYVTHDCGHTWRGPQPFHELHNHAELHGLSITARTDYVVQGPRSCLLMLSARKSAELGADRVFCARTTDAGKSFEFVSWVVPPSDPHRAVMPTTVTTSTGQLVTAVRRRQAGGERCWIDAYASTDDGQRWRFVSQVADTGGWNGNPPALARLSDGQLCCVFGERNACHMVAMFSGDQGQTWGRRTILRNDFHRDAFGDPDLGYARVTQRADGRMIAIYYWATAGMPHQHIAATIWQP